MACLFRYLMALVLIVLTMTPANAQEGCEFENAEGFTGTAARDFVANATLDCMNARMIALEKSHAAMRKRLAELEARIGTIPSVYKNSDGEIEDFGEPYGEAVLSFSPPSRGRSDSMEISEAVLVALCGDAGGCRLTLLKTSTEDGADESSTPDSPCSFWYNSETGAWRINEACGGAKGVDGNGGLPNADNPNGQVIYRTGDGCAVAESEVGNARGDDGSALPLRDRRRDMFLISGFNRGAGQDYVCDLVIKK